MHELLHLLSVFFVISGLVCFFAIVADITTGRRQPMPVMNWVWPLTALWSSWLGLFAYFALGRAEKTGFKTMAAHVKTDDKKMPGMKMDNMKGMDMKEMKMSSAKKPTNPTFRQVTLSTLHCGAGCSLADILGEWITFFVPFYLLGSLTLGQWTLDYILALAIGVFFQFAAIRSMQKISKTAAVKRAFKVDFFSLTAWQIGMYGFMALAIFVWFQRGFFPKNTWQFWFLMQLAMCTGFLISFPANFILIKRGIKPAMD